jgi:NAD(P)H dehydrogenase (quinone)
MARVHIVFYSMYGHIFKMAQAVAEGVNQLPGAEAQLFRIAETLPDEVLVKMGALEARKAWAHLPVADPKKLGEADAVIIGTPTRFGASAAQVQAFLDATGQLWMQHALMGKVGSAFTSTATQHGGQETTLVHLHTFFLHQGMLVAGLPFACPNINTIDELSGGTPYGASTVTGGRGTRMPSENELAAARYQGKFVAEMATKLARKL